MTSKPNVTIDYDNLPPLGLNNPRIKALVEQSKIDKKERFRRSTRSFFESQTDEKPYYPSLYEQDMELAYQISYILSEPPPKHIYNDVS